MANYNSPKCFHDLKNKKFGRLTILNRCGKKIKGMSNALWDCKCECGKQVTIDSGKLVSGNTKSCGCLRIDAIKITGHKNRVEDGVAPLNALLRNYKNNSKNRNILFELSFSDFKDIVTKNCFYCGIYPKQTIKNYKRFTDVFFYNGIDRIDNKKGYIKDNVVPCCEYCNRAKYKRTSDEFEEWLCRLVNYRRKNVIVNL